MSFTTLISCTAAAAQLSNPDWCFIDCRFDLARPSQGPEWYAQGHLPGALYADLDSDLSSVITPRSGRHPLPQVGELVARLGDWGIGPTTQVVVYDQDIGMYASRLWWILRWLGHEAVAQLDGGYKEWLRLGLPQDRLPAQRPPASFRPQLQHDWAVSTAALAGMQPQTGLLLDARAAERYRGDVEPIDPVAGHIPGARNYPLFDNFDEEGLFKDAATLRAQFRAVLGGQDAEQVIHYCGSGVSACLNILAMEYAGMKGSRLYPGSWSEWIRDPSRGVARGVYRRSRYNSASAAS